MTLDEEAAKAIRGWLKETGIMYLHAERDMLHAVVAAFGRRCAEAMREECGRLPQCPQCGCVGEVTLSWKPEKIPHGDRGQFTEAIVPVWQCNYEGCEFTWTDWRAEDIRAQAMRRVEIGGK